MTETKTPTPIRKRKRLTWTPFPTQYGNVSRKFLKANGLPIPAAPKERTRTSGAANEND